MKAKYFKLNFDMTEETMAMVKMQNGRSLRVDSSSVNVMKHFTEEDWINDDYIETTAAEFDAFYTSTQRHFDSLLNPSHEPAI